MGGVYFSSSNFISLSSNHPSWLVAILPGSGYFCAVAFVPLNRWIREYGLGDDTSCCSIMVRPFPVRIVLVLIFPLKGLLMNSLKLASSLAFSSAKGFKRKSLDDIDTILPK